MKKPLNRHPRTMHRGQWGALAVLITGLLTGAAVTPAVAHDSESLEYVAFGDSYTSGIGAPDVKVSPLYPAVPADKACYQASPGYVDVLGSRDGIELAANAACGGWTAAMVPAQVEVASTSGKLDAGTDLVTITAGGNDVNFGNILAACLAPSTLDTCKSTVRAAEVVARTEVQMALTTGYSAIRAKAPNATIVAVGYPHLFSPEFGDQPYITKKAARVFNDGTDTLNRVIRKAARQSGAEYVDVTDEFNGHGLGSPHPWINFNPANPSDTANFHPNATGYEEAYALAVLREVGICALVH